jgi:hypothetical protein
MLAPSADTAPILSAAPTFGKMSQKVGVRHSFHLVWPKCLRHGKRPDHPEAAAARHIGGVPQFIEPGVDCRQDVNIC